MTEEEKLELVKSRFEDIEEGDLMDGDEFFDSLDNSEEQSGPFPAKQGHHQEYKLY